LPKRRQGPGLLSDYDIPNVVSVWTALSSVMTGFRR